MTTGIDKACEGDWIGGLIAGSSVVCAPAAGTILFIMALSKIRPTLMGSRYRVIEITGMITKENL